MTNAPAVLGAADTLRVLGSLLFGTGRALDYLLEIPSTVDRLPTEHTRRLARGLLALRRRDPEADAAAVLAAVRRRAPELLPILRRAAECPTTDLEDADDLVRRLGGEPEAIPTGDAPAWWLALSDPEQLECLGPSWSAMSPTERAARGGAPSPGGQQAGRALALVGHGGAGARPSRRAHSDPNIRRLTTRLRGLA